MNYNRPFTYGPNIDSYTAVCPQAEQRADGLKIDFLFLKSFPGDCGALIMTCANYADEDSLRNAAACASAGGFSRIIATIAGKDLDNLLSIYKSCKWKVASKGKSNRNPDKTHVVLVKSINNCKYKGY